jgi:hypothetical protein
MSIRQVELDYARKVKLICLRKCRILILFKIHRLNTDTNFKMVNHLRKINQKFYIDNCNLYLNSYYYLHLQELAFFSITCFTFK